ncbi:GDP-L-fucose synthase [Oleisolibacter albus]|uniref:GDP-L-fucose synthase n=1 Tax=Oleisolibacter albus TaxID=2171757 RepID=UPI000DF18F8B|nr:GDP-L-fucose synthase [Oleisolibacter albus]
MSGGFDLGGRRVWVAGHRGMVGAAVCRRLAGEDCTLLTVGRERLDLRDQRAVLDWMRDQRPDVVVLAAARVGGIHANDSQPAVFLYENLMIEANIIEAARQTAVERLLFLGSSCIYPRLAEQPIRESSLLTGPLEPTNQWYAVAKIAGIKLCQAYRRQYGCRFISAMPANLYGPGDNFDLTTSHVLPALMRKIHEAAERGAETVEVWGTGRPRREFLHVDDLADALLFLLRHYDGEEPVNVGTGEDIAIADLARTLADVVGWSGRIVYDPGKPDGTPRKVMDVSRLADLGWTARIGLTEGLASTYAWFRSNSGTLRQSRPVVVPAA